jgi:hypothetical protein
MLTQQTQVKLNLPSELKEYLESKAGKFGMPLAGYIRHLILKDVADMDYPVYIASVKTETAYKKAREEEKAGHLIEVDNLDKFFNKL